MVELSCVSDLFVGGVSGVWLDDIVMEDTPGIPSHGCMAARDSNSATSACRNHVDLHVECVLLLFDLNQNWNELTDFFKTPQYQM
jgi:hypothetical protein